MKIYIITDGSYSDYHICAVYTKKEDADKYANQFKCGVEEWELDNDLSILEHNKIFRVYMDKAGNTTSIHDVSSTSYAFNDAMNKEIGWAHPGNILYMTVFAEDEQHAVKILNEKRAQLIAENQWKEIK